MRTFLLFLILLSFDVVAEEQGPVSGTLTLRHVSADSWQADYRFSEAINVMELGPAIVDFRRDAWTIATPGLTFAADAGNEEVRSAREPFDSLRIGIRLYEAWSHDAYVPMDRHTDGGTAIYLGHFMGRVRQKGVERKLLLSIRLKGLHGETTFLPEEANLGIGVYAYFGPQSIATYGSMRTFIDPATPAWIHETLADTGAKVAAIYESRLGRSAPATLGMIVGAGGLEKSGYSIKGGALPGQIFFKLQGRDLLTDTPQGRQRLQQVLAHELAHVWQGLVARGGIGDTQPPWVHEGGAEALSLQALRLSELWTSEQVAEKATHLQRECRDSQAKHAADPSLPPIWRDHYTCGFLRYQNFSVDALTLWRRLLASTEINGEPYSEAMIQAVLAKEAGLAQPIDGDK